jgi:hypothetical protein
MTSALFAIRFASVGARFAIGAHSIRVFISCFHWASGQVFVHDGLQKRACAHCTDFEEANLFASQTHLSDGIIDDHAEFGMETNLKRIAAHSTPKETRAPPKKTSEKRNSRRKF